jgi:cell division transport system permease protein
MKLVGATPGFIKIPFYFEGGLQGLIGSAASLVILLMLHGLFLSELSRQVHFYSLFMEIRFLTPATIGFIVVGGGLLGILGSFFSLLQLRDR